MRYTNRLPVIAIPVIIFAIVIGIYILASPSGSSTMAKSGSSIEAPDFTFALLDGEKVSLSDYRGKPVVLNFWATWCPPCREETPVMVKISDKYEEQVQFLGVVQDGPPDEGCIFGQAVRRLELRKGFEYLFDGFAGRENAIITTLKENGWDVGMTAEEKDWMETVQMDQDSGKTWATAVYG